VSTGNLPDRPCSTGSIIGPAVRWQAKVMSTLGRDPRTSIAIPMALSRISGAISFMSSSFRRGTFGPRTEVGLAARIEM
jgi:hypothetical protein